MERGRRGGDKAGGGGGEREGRRGEGFHEHMVTE